MPLNKPRARIATQLLLLLVLQSLSAISLAAWVTAEGQAPILNQDLEAARQAAINNALQNIPKDTHNLSVTPQYVEVISQQQDQRQMSVVIKAQLTHPTQNQCPQQENPRLKKNVVLLHIENQFLNYQSDETLHNLSQGLSQRLQRQWYSQQQLNITDQSRLKPTFSGNNSDQLSSDFLQHIKNLAPQFVLYATVQDYSLFHANAHSQKSWYQSLLDTVDLHQEAYRRNFMMYMDLYDAITGRRLQRFPMNTSGLWNQNNLMVQDLLGEPFWQSDYGQSIQKLLLSQAEALTQHIHCQPFVARVIKVDNQYVYINQGSLSNLQKNDILGLYHNEQLELNGQSYRKFTNSQAQISITQVQPDFAIGKLLPGANQFNIQMDDLAIAW